MGCRLTSSPRRERPLIACWIVGVGLLGAGCGVPNDPGRNDGGFDGFSGPPLSGGTGSYVLFLADGEGGQIKSDLNNRFKVWGDSFGRDTLTVTMTEIRYDDGIEFRFGPSGIHFDPPARLSVDTHLFDGGSDRTEFFDLFYYDEESDTWILEERRKADAGRFAEFDIDHFSLYAVSQSSTVE